MNATLTAKFTSVHLASKDLSESRTFFVDVLGGALVSEDPSAVRVRLGDFDLVASPQRGGGALVDAEYPHYALTVSPEQFVGLKQRIEAFRIPHNHPWSRIDRKYALMYFRDPSGNQYELFAPDGAGAVPLRMGKKSGGDYTIDFRALSYDRMQPPADMSALPPATATGFNHLTMPCRDLAEAKRFLLEVVGSYVTYEARTHVTTSVGGVEIGVAPQKGGWTGPDARYPHYAFAVDADALRTMQHRLMQFGVPTQPIARGSDGSAVLFFRDPSGNLWRFFSPDAPRSIFPPDAPAEDKVDVRALNYDRWN